MTITYRKPHASDAPALAELGRSSFVDAFASLYSSQDLNSFLDTTYQIEKIRAEIADPAYVHLIAEEAGIMVGFCKLGLDFGFDHDLGGRRGMELKQLYLRGNRTAGGTGSTFMAWAIAEGRAREFDDIILSVWSGNHAAQRFYQRHGFEKVGDTYFMVGNQRDDEFLFGLRLTQ